jgi:hypothetical protein
MRFLATAIGAICLSVALGSAASAAEVKLRLVDAEAGLAGQQVAIFMSNGKLEGVTDAAGVVRFDVPRGAGMWVEVNGQRLRTFYREGQIPATIDPQIVGFMTWQGGD